MIVLRGSGYDVPFLDTISFVGSEVEASCQYEIAEEKDVSR